MFGAPRRHQAKRQLGHAEIGQDKDRGDQGEFDGSHAAVIPAETPIKTHDGIEATQHQKGSLRKMTLEVSKASPLPSVTKPGFSSGVNSGQV